MDNKKQNPSPAFILYKIIAAGLILAMTILVAGFILNILKFGNTVDVDILKKSTFTLAGFFEIINNPVLNKLPLVNYAGIFILILTPIAGLVCALVYYVLKRNLKHVLIIAGIIIILAASTVIGFFK